MEKTHHSLTGVNTSKYFYWSHMVYMINLCRNLASDDGKKKKKTKA